MERFMSALCRRQATMWGWQAYLVDLHSVLAILGHGNAL